MRVIQCPHRHGPMQPLYSHHALQCPTCGYTVSGLELHQTEGYQLQAMVDHRVIGQQGFYTVDGDLGDDPLGIDLPGPDLFMKWEDQDGPWWLGASPNELKREKHLSSWGQAQALAEDLGVGHRAAWLQHQEAVQATAMGEALRERMLQAGRGPAQDGLQNALGGARMLQGGIDPTYVPLPAEPLREAVEAADADHQRWGWRGRMKELWGRIQITGPIMQAAREEPGIFRRTMERLMATEDPDETAQNIHRMWYGDREDP